MAVNPYGQYYEGASMVSGMAFPPVPVRGYPEGWRGYGQPPADYQYDEREYEHEVYRRDYDRRAPPT